MLLGQSNTSTIGMYGCKLTSLAMLAYITPPEANKKLLDGGAFTGDLISDDKASVALSLPYNGRFAYGAIPDPKGVCMAEVDMSPAPNKQQHFVVWLGFENKIIDPWTGTVVKNPYTLVSWRMFVEKKPETQKQKILKLIEELRKQTELLP